MLPTKNWAWWEFLPHVGSYREPLLGNYHHAFSELHCSLKSVWPDPPFDFIHSYDLLCGMKTSTPCAPFPLSLIDACRHKSFAYSITSWHLLLEDPKWHTKNWVYYKLKNMSECRFKNFDSKLCEVSIYILKTNTKPLDFIHEVLIMKKWKFIQFIGTHIQEDTLNFKIRNKNGKIFFWG